MLKGAALTDLFLQIRIGGDQALFRLLNKLILETEGAVDQPFIDEHTHGYEEFAAARAGGRLGRDAPRHRADPPGDREGP